jgi:putative ABC transport system permease protein
VPGSSGLEQVPSLRGRITRLAGQPVKEAIRQGRGSWALDGDRGLTYAASPPAGSRIVAGQWWPADYHGSPLVSLDAAVAKQLRLGIGDTLTVNVLGREVTARVASLREIDWTSLGINFVMLFSPGILEHAPQTYIATIRATDAAEEPVLRAVVDRFPNVTAIRVKEALAEVETLLGQVGSAVRLTAAFTLLAGMLVLASAIAAEHSRRVYDAVVLKVLGAGRRRLFATFLIEYGLLGLAASLLAALFGGLAGWLLVTRVMEQEWVFLPGGVALIVLAAVALTLLFGFAGTWRALGQKPARLLRNE